MQQLEQYMSWRKQYSQSVHVTHLRFVLPDGTHEKRDVFEHLPAKLVYFEYGYESIGKDGDPVLEVRFTPIQEGLFTYYAMCQDRVIDEGSFYVFPHFILVM